ncbi:MAG: glucoamylase family protein [Lacipirellulaceae bacterium]
MFRAPLSAAALLLTIVSGVALAADVLPSDASRQAWAYRFTAADEALLDDVQRGCFLYFWREVGAPACLARDKSTDTVSSVASVGFQLSSLPIGVERGWVSRDAARQRALTVLRSLVERDDNKRDGVYFHYLNADSAGLPDLKQTKHRYEILAGTVDHALLQAGVMTAGQYFGGGVKRLADALVAGANYRAFRRNDDGFVSMGWLAADEGLGPLGAGELIDAKWFRCSDEERLVYFLGAGAPNDAFALPPIDYYRLMRKVDRFDDLPEHVTSYNGSLFTYFFSHCWIDYRSLGADNPSDFGIEGPRVDWFENTRRAALSQRARSQSVAGEFAAFRAPHWGLAPCSFGERYFVHDVRPNHSGRDDWCEGVMPPYGAASVLPMTPSESIAALRAYRELKDAEGRPLVWRDPTAGGYGFVDSFKLDPPEAPEVYLGIDQGPMLLAIENARTGLVWKLFMSHPAAERGVARLKLGTGAAE